MTTITITIPPAALEAACRAYTQIMLDVAPESAIEAAFLAMLTAWPGMIHGKYFAEPSIILPLPPQEKTDDKA